MALHTAIAQCGRVTRLSHHDQETIYAEIQRSVSAQSRITVLAAWLLNVYFAWLSTDQIKHGAAKGTHALFTAAASLVNNTGHAKTGSSQPLLKQCFTEVFQPLVPDTVWPRFKRSGNYAAAIGRTFHTVYQVYTSCALDAHAVAHLRVEGAYPPNMCLDGHHPPIRVPKRIAKAAWARAKHLLFETAPPELSDLSSLSDYQKEFPYVDGLAEQMGQLLRCDPLLLHRYLLEKIETRHRALKGHTVATGHTFPLFPVFKIKQQFVALDAKTNFLDGHDSSEVLAAMFPHRKGWTPSHQITTDGIRIALTYTRTEQKRSVGGDTMRQCKRQKRPLSAREKDITRPPHSSFHSGCDAALVHLRTASKGVYHLRDIQIDATLPDTAWEAFDPGLNTLYMGHKGTSMGRDEYRHRTDATKTALKTMHRQARNERLMDALTRLTTATLKSADLGIITTHLKEWLGQWETLWEEYGCRWWGHQRFKSYQKEQRTLAKIADTLLGTDRTKIAVFGNGVFPQCKGLPPVPITKVRDYLARHGRVVLVDEFRTSQVCHACHGETRQCASNHTTKHCRSENHTLSSWNRDVNACRNIAHIFKRKMQGEERPIELCYVKGKIPTMHEGIVVVGRACDVETPLQSTH